MVHRRARLIRSSTTRGGSHIQLVAAGLGSGVLSSQGSGTNRMHRHFISRHLEAEDARICLSS